jgi:hypothetical protein
MTSLQATLRSLTSITSLLLVCFIFVGCASYRTADDERQTMDEARAFR